MLRQCGLFAAGRAFDSVVAVINIHWQLVYTLFAEGVMAGKELGLYKDIQTHGTVNLLL